MRTDIFLLVLDIGIALFWCVLFAILYINAYVEVKDVVIFVIVIISAIIAVLFVLFVLKPLKAHAAPPGYAKYGELAEEQYCDDLQLLGCIVWAEAGNQDAHGKELVADVVLNRVDDPRFPDTIREVIFQKGQFSTVRNGALDRAYYNVTQECFDAVSNELLSRNDSEALFFCASNYSMYGSPLYKYGDHYFSK